MPESYPHLPLQRETPVNNKRPRPPFFNKKPPDILAHTRGLQQTLAQAKGQDDDVGGFDERRLFRFSVLLRALLCAHAVMPEPCQNLIDQNKEFRAVCGYGRVDEPALYRSLENAVTLVANEMIANKHHHFYEIPIPSDFTSGGKRSRKISVALAYTPPVRTTRIKYRATRIDFRLVAAPDLEHVTTMFNQATAEEDFSNIPEFKKGKIGQMARSKGTVQADSWQFESFTRNALLKNKRLFAVVTRNDFPWGENLCSEKEDYTLVVSLHDRENENARLYSQIRAKVQAKIRMRAK